MSGWPKPDPHGEHGWGRAMIKTEFQAKESSNIDWARYANGKLRVDFKNKKGVKVSTYEYDGTLIAGGANPTGCFPESEWLAFCAASSKGQHFAYKIRPVYKGVKA